ncbi:MAG: DUF3575 domain-containing protein [Algicola sp.]|nr:DUF3575 domain-containing protein [Algicola sp.]
MRNIVFALVLICSVFTIKAQEQELEGSPYYAKHEVKLNGIMLVVGAFEVGYEYLLNDESGVGISVFLPYDDEVLDDIKYYVSPYYRYYFGKKYAGGFFLEGFGMLNRSDRELKFFFFDDNRDNFVTDFALGLGIGGKWITKKGFVGEINYGFARQLFETNESEYNFIGKFGISIGYRF